MEFISKVNGKLEYDKKDIVIFKRGIPGLEEFTKYILKDIKECEPFKVLQSLENDEIGFIVVSPFEAMEDYEVSLSKDVIKNLEIESPEEVALYTTVNLNSDIKKITTNLKAPLIINIKNGFGEQIIVDRKKYEIKHPMYKG